MTVTPHKKTTEGFLVEVKVIPSAKQDLIEHRGGQICVRTREPADKDKANKAVIKLLKPYLGKCRIVFGHKNRKKTIFAEKVDFSGL